MSSPESSREILVSEITQLNNDITVEERAEFLTRFRELAHPKRDPAASALKINASTIYRYERPEDATRPEPAYLAVLAEEVLSRVRLEDQEIGRQHLVDLVNWALGMFYKSSPLFGSWEGLSAVADTWRQKQQQKQVLRQQSASALASDESPEAEYPPPPSTFPADEAPETENIPAVAHPQRSIGSRTIAFAVAIALVGLLVIGIIAILMSQSDDNPRDARATQPADGQAYPAAASATPSMAATSTTNTNLITGTIPTVGLSPDAELHISFLYDTNYYDDSVITPTSVFHKGWRVYNRSAVDLTPDRFELRKWADIGKELPDIGSGGYELEQAIPAGQDADIYTGPIVAPSEPGCYQVAYKMYSRERSESFGDALWFQIVVPDSTRPIEKQSFMLFINHFGVNEGTVFSPGDEVPKVWGIYNCGYNTWQGYRARRISGDFGPEIIEVPVVSPHQPLYLRSTMTAPENLGEYISIYQLETAEGEAFGDKLRVHIKVK
ncbi:MAG: hypothetical protein H0T53_05495 [Herpetosiphonaceae bacterium]|nr:hypothetical protein [Herpetosiphonaceae bacterium]